jgi:hypothetical protein
MSRKVLIPVSAMPQKWVECDDCGHVNLQTKAFPLKLSSCKTCGSVRIRLYKPKDKP